MELAVSLLALMVEIFAVVLADSGGLLLAVAGAVVDGSPAGYYRAID